MNQKIKEILETISGLLYELEQEIEKENKE